MKALFKNPQIRQKVILKDDNLNTETQQWIVEVTPKGIHVSSCNLYKFNRSGLLNKADSRGGEIKMSIRPVDA